jgi:hypothetical protein
MQIVVKPEQRMEGTIRSQDFLNYQHIQTWSAVNENKEWKTQFNH